MAWITVNKVNSDNQITSYNIFDAESDANAKVVELTELGLSNVYAVEKPDADIQHLIPNVSNKTVAINTSAKTAEETEQKKQKLRSIRSPLIKEADHTIWTLEDAGSDTSAWKTYRQKLRDITKDADLDNPTWPDKPS